MGIKWLIVVACLLGTAAGLAQQKATIKVRKDTVPDRNLATVYSIADQMPQYPGAPADMVRFIQQNIRFPENKRLDSTFTGCYTYIRMIIDSTGRVTSPTVIKGCNNCPECDAEAIRVIKLMPRWVPGLKNGKPVNMYFSMPIKFAVR